MTTYVTNLLSMSRTDISLIIKAMESYRALTETQTTLSPTAEHIATQLEIFQTLITKILKEQNGIDSLELLAHSDTIDFAYLNETLSMAMLSACSEYVRHYKTDDGNDICSHHEWYRLLLIQEKITSGLIQISRNNFWQQ